MENESQAMQKLVTPRLIAMAEYIFTTPGGSVLAERMYLALGDAWQHNRTTHGGDDLNCNPWDGKTVELHSAILEALRLAASESHEDAFTATTTRPLNIIDARHRFSRSTTPSLQPSETELLESYRQLPPERQKDVLLIAEAYHQAHGVANDEAF